MIFQIQIYKKNLNFSPTYPLTPTNKSTITLKYGSHETVYRTHF